MMNARERRDFEELSANYFAQNYHLMKFFTLQILLNVVKYTVNRQRG